MIADDIVQPIIVSFLFIPIIEEIPNKTNANAKLNFECCIVVFLAAL